MVGFTGQNSRFKEAMRLLGQAHSPDQWSMDREGVFPECSIDITPDVNKVTASGFRYRGRRANSRGIDSLDSEKNRLRAKGIAISKILQLAQMRVDTILENRLIGNPTFITFHPGLLMFQEATVTDENARIRVIPETDGEPQTGSHEFMKMALSPSDDQQKIRFDLFHQVLTTTLGDDFFNGWSPSGSDTHVDRAIKRVEKQFSADEEVIIVDMIKNLAKSIGYPEDGITCRTLVEGEKVRSVIALPKHMLDAIKANETGLSQQGTSIIPDGM